MRCTGAPHRGHGRSNRPWTAMPSLNAVTLSRERVATLRPKPLDPASQRVHRRAMQAFDPLLIEMARQLQGRELRRVQDLVGIRIADSAEQPGIRQRPFQRVVLHSQPRSERRRTAGERVDASGIEIVQAVEAAHERQRGAPPGARLCQDQRAGRELESCESLARDARPASASSGTAPQSSSETPRRRHRRMPRRSVCQSDPGR